MLIELSANILGITISADAFAMVVWIIHVCMHIGWCIVFATISEHNFIKQVLANPRMDFKYPDVRICWISSGICLIWTNKIVNFAKFELKKWQLPVLFQIID